MTQLRTRFLAFVLSLLLIPIQLLFSAPAAANPLPPAGVNGGSLVANVGIGPVGSLYWLDGQVDFGQLTPVGIRVDVYDASGQVVLSTATTSLSFGPPVSCSGSPAINPEIQALAPVGRLFIGGPAPTCASYSGMLGAPGTYRIKATLGSYTGQTTVSTENAVPNFIFPAVYAPLIKLTHRAYRPETPEVQPTPPPPPVSPTLTVNTLPTQTDATYFLVSGTATPGAAVRFEVGGNESSTYLVGEKGTFMLGASLVSGENHLKVTATKAGGATTFEATVTQAPKPEEPKAPAPPEVTVTTPVVPTPPTTVLPENAVSRAEFAQMMARAFHLPGAGMLSLELPTGPITRAEAALLAAKALRLAGIQSAPAALSFTDAAAIPYPTDVALAVGAGLVVGLPDGSFRPTTNLTRAEATTSVERAVTLMGH